MYQCLEDVDPLVVVGTTELVVECWDLVHSAECFGDDSISLVASQSSVAL